LKLDGFRAIAYNDRDGCRLISRNGNDYSWSKSDSGREIRYAKFLACWLAISFPTSSNAGFYAGIVTHHLFQRGSCHRSACCRKQNPS
jgi:hypothetical protein